MTAKEYLQSVRRANTDADRHISRLEHYREAAGYGTGKREATRISGTSQRSRVEDNVCALIDLEREAMAQANCAVDVYVDAKEEARQVIERIPRQDYRTVLTLYYLDCLTWDKVAERMGKSRQWVHRLHGWALVVFERIWKNHNI